MFLNHMAAIFLFSGPLFYVGLWLAVDPVGCASLPLWLLARLGGMRGRKEPAAVPRRLRPVLRIAGIGLLLLAAAL